MSDVLSPLGSRVVALAAAAALLATGCSPEKSAKTGETTSPSGETTQVAAKTESKPVIKADYAKANELGLVPVLEYHRFDTKEERWTRTYDNFRKDLEWLYANDYVLVNMADVAERKLDLPAGKKPVVLTFDDSTEGQFRYLQNADGSIKRDAAGKPVIDPNSAIGIMDAFYAKHPEFGRAGTFYVLPSGFEQSAVIGEKFRYLVETGREIGNHTYGHANMAPMTVAQVNEAVGKLQTFISKQVGEPYEVKTLALPFGIGPKSPAALQAVMKGGSGESSYHHKAVMLVGANPNVSPYDKAYKPHAVARIQCIDSEFRNWFNRKPGFTGKTTEPWLPYVSDGDPSKVTFPVAMKAKFNPGALGAGQKANPFDPKAAADLAKSDASEDDPAAPTASQAVQPSEAPKSTATETHPGYASKLPAGALYDQGQVHYTVKSGDSVEAIAYRMVKYTDYYTYPALASAIRKENNLGRPLRIGEVLRIPSVRQAPPKPKMEPKAKTYEARGVYVTGTIAGSESVWKLIKELKAKGGNTIVFDAKDMSGVISYDSQVPLAKEIKAYEGGMIQDLPKFIERAHAEGVHIAARLVLFHDAKLARKKPQYALKSKRTGKPWLENGHLLWADPSLQVVQDYNLALAKELIAHGVDEIQYDYVRFPAQGDTADIAWSTMATQKVKHEVITSWVKRAYETIHPTGALVSADVYGVVAWDQGIDVKITGQKLEDMSPHLDVLSPMLYPSHFYGTFDKKDYPPDHPAYFVGEGVKRVAAKTEGSGVVIRPWIQAFPYRIRNYGPEYVRVQVVAGNENGGTGWLLWNAENDYKVGFAGVAKIPAGGGAGN